MTASTDRGEVKTQGSKADRKHLYGEDDENLIETKETLTEDTCEHSTRGQIGSIDTRDRYALRRGKRISGDFYSISGDKMAISSSELSTEGGNVKLYNKLLLTELLKSPEDGISASERSLLSKTTGKIDAISKLKLLSSPSYSSVLLSPAGRELINRQNSDLQSFSTRPTNVLTARDWSESNILAIGLGSEVYLWSASSKKVSKVALYFVPQYSNIKKFSGLMKGEGDDPISSVSWFKGTKLAIGTFSGKVSLWDVIERRRIRYFEGHVDRVAALIWSSCILSSGSRDKSIVMHDARLKKSILVRLQGHDGEVCSLRWNSDGKHMASGGNDNNIIIWDKNELQPYTVIKDSHTAAVKALSWSPKTSHILASGGGDTDRTIKIWNVNTNEVVRVVTTDSQICNLHWMSPVDQLVSSHGYSQNAVAVWRPTTSSYKQVALFTGHTRRALYMAHSPDDTMVATGSPDGTLRFWNVYPLGATKSK